MSMIEKLFTWSNMPAYQSWGNFGLAARIWSLTRQPSQHKTSPE